MSMRVLLESLVSMATLWLVIMLAIVMFMVSVRIVTWLAKKIL